MITLSQYAGKWAKHKDWTPERKANAAKLLEACDKLESLMAQDGVDFLDNPVTRNGISGATFGGFRPQECTIGAPSSSHKEGLGVDRYDPDGEIDMWCLANQGVLAECGIYIESPSKTRGWSHWTIRAPRSGRTVFLP
jgi:hypothetical protein